MFRPGVPQRDQNLQQTYSYHRNLATSQSYGILAESSRAKTFHYNHHAFQGFLLPSRARWYPLSKSATAASVGIIIKYRFLKNKTKVHISRRLSYQVESETFPINDDDKLQEACKIP